MEKTTLIIQKNEKRINLFSIPEQYLSKFLIIIILLIIMNAMQNKESLSNYFLQNNFKYFSCVANIGKFENRYASEFIKHYLSLGVEKFYLMDDNTLSSEKLIDVLNDYVNKNIVEIFDNRGKKMGMMDFYEYILKYAKYKCKWILYYDYDEHLEFVDKNMTIKKYLSRKIFDKCDVIKIHWLMYYDNGLIKYDNRTLKDRFPNSTFGTFENNFHKSIVRVQNYPDNMWTENTGPHQPNESFVNMCDAEGEFSNIKHGYLTKPIYSECYLKHYSMKTAEEYALKLVRGEPKENKYNVKELNEKLDRFFKYNKFTKKKLAFFENMLNMTFPKYHKIKFRKKK